jgi:AraC-like DNA-binding protein
MKSETITEMEEQARIKGMVCRRCIETVKEIFMDEGFTVSGIDLGQVTYHSPTADVSLKEVSRRLKEEGFSLLDDKQSRTVAKVKELVEEHLSGPDHANHNFSQMVMEALHTDYGTVSALFSQTEGITLEQYLIRRRIGKVQDLLKNSDFSLTDIAFRLNYSSVHHLSNQFRKVTGLSPSQYREQV